MKKILPKGNYIMRKKKVIFTGHRPEKLPGMGNDSNPLLQMLKSILYYQIYSSAEEGYEYFISGLARGVDLWAAEYVLEIKKKFPQIKLICAKPYPAHGSNFKGSDLFSLRNVLEKADEVVCVSDEYSRDCYKNRNYYMVDRSSKLIAMVNDYKSGTGQTISYAKKNGLLLSVTDISKYDFGKYTKSDSKIFFD